MRRRVEGRYVVRVGHRERTFRSVDCLSVEFVDKCYRRALTWLEEQMREQEEPCGEIEHWDGAVLVERDLHTEDWKYGTSLSYPD